MQNAKLHSRRAVPTDISPQSWNHNNNAIPGIGTIVRTLRCLMAADAA